MIFNNLLTDGQSQTGAAGAAAVERFEDVGQGVGRYSRTVIADHDFYAFLAVPHLKIQGALALKGLEGVHAQIEQHLLDLLSIHGPWGKIRRNRHHDGDVLEQRPIGGKNRADLFQD